MRIHGTAFGILAAGLVLAACASAPVREIVPATLVSEAAIPAFGNVRMWGDGDATDVDKFLQADGDLFKRKWRARAAKKKGRLEANLLALSGGGDDGAFGAGLLVGWSEAGTRPEFDLVTGISAGALIAPMAFLGPEYDGKLATFFTQHDKEDILQATVLSGIFGGSSLADSFPLERLISQYVDMTVLRRVAEERAKGRLLVIGTTNIDAQRPVYWDMGRIAQQGNAKALELFRKVLLASASIPGVFPPVHINVTANGKTYQELHVDGGTTNQIFLSPGDFSFRSLDRKLGKSIKRRLYIVRNSKIDPEWKPTKETTIGLAQRSLETLIKNQGIGDLIRMYEKAKKDGIRYHLIAIPDDFKAPRKAPFDLAYMKPLYGKGYRTGREGIPWRKKPPGL